jgi:hypothetical protein
MTAAEIARLEKELSDKGVIEIVFVGLARINLFLDAFQN